MSSLKDDLRVVLPAWIEARVYMLAVLIVSWGIVDHLEPPPAFTPVEDGLLAWDGTWYEAIADNGYQGADDSALRFFPLFPMFGRLVGFLFGGNNGLALTVIANVAALAAAVALYRLVRLDIGDKQVARRSSAFLMLLPPAFVLVMAYSESVYLLLSIGCFLALARKKWWAAAALGFMSGLTRPVGALLFFPAAYAVWQSGRRQIDALAATVAAPAGALSFFVWSFIKFDDFWAPSDNQTELRGEISEPFSRLIRAFNNAIDGDEGDALHLLAAVVIIGLTIVVVMRLPRIYAAYQVPYTLLLVSTENLNSLERYALSSFPLVIAFAVLLTAPNVERAARSAAPVGFVCLGVLALHGVYVP